MADSIPSSWKAQKSQSFFFSDRICKHFNLTWDLLSFLQLFRSCTLTFWLSSYFMLPHHILLLLLNFLTHSFRRVFPSYHFKPWFSSRLCSFPSPFLSAFWLNFPMILACCLLYDPHSDHVCALKSSTKRCDDSCVQIVDTCKYLGSPEAELF